MAGERTIVIDTSALLAVLVNEPAKPRILSMTRGMELLAPPSLPWEIGNAFSAMFKRKRISLSDALLAFRDFRAIPIQETPILIEAAIELSASLGIYAYDSYILLCAQVNSCPLLTLDKGLKSAAQRAGVDILELAT